MQSWKSSIMAIALGLLHASAMAQDPSKPAATRASSSTAAAKPQAASPSESTSAKPATGDKWKKAKKE